MKKEIILGVIIIFLIIIISYRHVPINSNSNTNDDFIEEENPYTSVWDLNQYPTDFNNKSVKIKGIISEVEYDERMESGIIIQQTPSPGFRINSRNLISFEVNK